MGDALCSAAGLVPHQKPMRLVDAVLWAERDRGQVEARVKADNPLLGLQALLSASYMELMAQAEAALQGWRHKQEGLPMRMGYLVGVRSMEVFHSARLGDELAITGAEHGQLGQLPGDRSPG